MSKCSCEISSTPILFSFLPQRLLSQTVEYIYGSVETRNKNHRTSGDMFFGCSQIQNMLRFAMILSLFVFCFCLLFFDDLDVVVVNRNKEHSNRNKYVIYCIWTLRTFPMNVITDQWLVRMIGHCILLWQNCDAFKAQKWTESGKMNGRFVHLCVCGDEKERLRLLKLNKTYKRISNKKEKIQSLSASIGVHR